MERSTLLRTALPAVLTVLLSSCASSKPVVPSPDPAKEQILILQKQILELQALHTETRRKLDEQTTLTETLTTRLRTVEEQRAADRAAYAAAAEQSAAASKKKAATKPAASKKKKSKTVRRQEQ